VISFKAEEVSMDTKHLATLKAQIAEPGPQKQGNREFVGQDRANGFHIALSQNDGGEIVGFVADGKNPGVWFTGTTKENVVQATGSRNERLTARLAKDGAEGEAEVAGKRLAFTLDLADEGSGLRRVVRSIRGKEFDATFVITNEGSIAGSADTQNATVFSYQSNAEAKDPEPNISYVDDSNSDDPVTTGFLRCSILVLRFHWRGNSAAVQGGSTSPNGTANPFESPEQQEIRGTYNGAGCQAFYGSM
jgi:hypothetical protein